MTAFGDHAVFMINVRVIDRATSCVCLPRRTLLHAAASNGNADLVKFLLEKGSSPNTSDDEVFLIPIAFIYRKAPEKAWAHRDVM